MSSPNRPTEQSPLLQDHQDSREFIKFSKRDAGNPRQWSRAKKFINVAVIACMAVMSPLASSMFTPGIDQIASDLGVDQVAVVGAATGYVIFLGIGPLVLAPLSETFGRRKLYLWCFGAFSILQIPTALSPNIQAFLLARTVSGFFGSWSIPSCVIQFKGIGIANGGGTISDMFHPSERAGVFGWYLLGPVIGPSLGPLFGGLIVEYLGWRWIFWILSIVCTCNTILGFIFLQETYAPVILESRRDNLEKKTGNRYRIVDEDERPFRKKLASSMNRPIRILFTQPIVFIMAIYQAAIFGTSYSLYTNFQAIYGNVYGFSPTQVGLVYMATGAGFLLALWLVVPKIDTVYNTLTSRNHDEPKPEFRLPLANIGSVLIPISLFWLAWTVEYRIHWFVPVLSSTFYGFGQLTVFNTVQNYYIDSFAKYAASAIAAGALFRSIVGGFVPLVASTLFDKIGYGWGISTFGFLNLALAPLPVLFYYYGEKLRAKYAIEL